MGAGGLEWRGGGVEGQSMSGREGERDRGREVERERGDRGGICPILVQERRPMGRGGGGACL